MSPITIVSSDRPDTLAERLALDLAREPLGPFADETIVIQSRGTERWIRHELARRHGCAAGLRFPFAASFFRALADSSASPVAGSADALARASTKRDDDPFGREALTWRIYDLLNGELCQQAGFETVRSFIMEESSRDMRKLLGLARVLAARFTEYQLYRPDVLSEWERGENVTDDWQGTLWRCICASNATSCHSASPRRDSRHTSKSW